MEPEKIDENTPAADTIAGHPQHSRSELMAMAMNQMGSMSTNDLSHWLYDALALSTSQKMAETIPDDAAKKNLATVEAKPSAATGAVKEDLENVIAGLELSTDTVDKLLVLFEAQVSARVAMEKARIEDEHEQKLNEEAEKLAERLDTYLDEAARNFLTENKLAIESSIRVDLYEEFIDGLKTLFTEHYVDIPEDKLDVLEELATKVETLENDLNEKAKEVIRLREALLGERARDIFAEASAGLTDLDREKMKQLSESIEFDGDEEDLKNKLKVIREAHFKTDKKEQAEKVLGENVEQVVTVKVETQPGEEEKVIIESADPAVRRYVEAASRIVKRSNV